MFSAIRGAVKAAAQRIAGGGGGTANGSIASGGGVRHFSRKAAVNVRKINPKVPITEAYSIAESLFNVIKTHGPLTVPNTWVQAQDTGISGLHSKTHMKIMLKWMRGRKMLKLICNGVGSSKKFFHSIPDDPQAEQPETPSEPKPKYKPPRNQNPARKQKRRSR